VTRGGLTANKMTIFTRSSKTGYGQGISRDAGVLRQERKVFIFSTDFSRAAPLLT